MKSYLEPLKQEKSQKKGFLSKLFSHKKKNETKEHFLGCPLYVDWKLGLGPNFVVQQRMWEKEHPEEVDRIIIEGTEKVRKLAKEQMKKIKDAMKLNYFEN